MRETTDQTSNIILPQYFKFRLHFRYCVFFLNHIFLRAFISNLNPHGKRVEVNPNSTYFSLNLNLNLPSLKQRINIGIPTYQVLDAKISLARRAKTTQKQQLRVTRATSTLLPGRLKLGKTNIVKISFRKFRKIGNGN